MNLQRVGPLYFLPATAVRLGAKPSEILAAAHLDPTALDQPEKTIPYAKVGALLKIAAEKTRCPHFGLELGCGIGLSSLGAVGELMRSAPTVGDALRDYAAHQHRYAHGGVVYLLPAANCSVWGYAVYQFGMEGGEHLYDLVAAIGLNILRELLGDRHTHFIEVLISRFKPADPSAYRRALGVNLKFDSDQTGLMLPNALLEITLPDAHAGRRKEWQNRVGSFSATGELDIVGKVSRALRVSLIGGDSSALKISAELGMTRRTLQRRLKAAGSSFQTLLDRTRYEIAQQLLANTGLSVAEVSMIVGYAEPSVLSRRFFHWSGKTPSEWRSGVRPTPIGAEA